MSDPLLSVHALSVDYVTANGSVRAVDGVSFDIGENEVLGLAGESGCGKSTVAFALMRLHRPPAFISAGRIFFEGRDILAFDRAEIEAWRWRRTSMVFQSAMNSLNPVITIFEQFRDMLARHERLDSAAARARAAEMLDMVGIPPERLDAYPHQLSGGMRQRVVLAMALTLRPKLVIMDEPTTALDVVVQREILHEIVALRRRLGFSILFITHDLALMAQFADRIAIMLEGRIVELDDAREIHESARHEYTRRLWQAMPLIGGETDMRKEHS